MLAIIICKNSNVHVYYKIYGTGSSFVIIGFVPTSGAGNRCAPRHASKPIAVSPLS